MAQKHATYSIPQLTVPESQKDESWHKQFVQAITSDSIDDSFTFNYAAMDEAVNFYQGLQNGDDFKFLQEAEDGDTLPAQWVNYNKIKTKIDLLLGELTEKGYELRVKAINKDAKSRRLEEKERVRVEMRLQELAENLEQTYGLALQSNEYLPENEEELDEYFNLTYKEKSEIIMEAAIKFLAKRNNWDYERMALFRDVLIMGRCFCRIEMESGLPVIRRVDPRLIIHDPNATDDFLSDSTYFGEVRYMSISEAADMYNLTREQIKQSYQSYQQFQRTNTTNAYTIDFTALDGTNLKYFKTDGGELRILVLTAYWVDTKILNNKLSEDKFGNEHITKVKDTYEGKKTLKKRIKIWRKGTLVGGKFLKNWGEVENQVRDVDNLSETAPPIKGFIPNYLNGAGVSKVHQLKGLQDFKDVVMYNIQLAMARAGAKGFIYDVSQLPDEWDIHTAIKYLKTVGIAFIDSKKDGFPSNYNQFQTIDMTLSASVKQYLEISLFIDQEMDAISGINEARQGIVKNASQAVGVTQSSLFQSNLSTATYFKMFERFCSDALNQQAKMVKIAWAGKEKFAPIIGDTGIDFLKENVDVDLNDYGVFVESVPPALDDINKFQELVVAALQSGQIEFVDAMKLLREKDLTVGIRRFEKDLMEKQAMEMQKEMQLAEQQQEMQANQLQMQRDQEQFLEQLKTQGELTLQNSKNNAKIEEILAKGRIDLAGKKIDAVSDQLKDMNKPK
jgi:hypothetical protein